MMVFSVFLLVTRRRRPRPRKDTFVLVGLSNAGKTALFHRLRHGAFVRSYASLKENEFKAALHSEVLFATYMSLLYFLSYMVV